MLLELTQEHKNIVQTILERNSKEFNLKKVLEEIAEFQEVVLKVLTKEEGKRPNEDEIFSEFGDLIIRGFAYICDHFDGMTSEEVQTQINEAISYKINKLNAYYNRTSERISE